MGVSQFDAMDLLNGLLAGMSAGILIAWSILQVTLIAVALIIFVSSAEDTLFDLSYWIYMLRWPLLWLRRPSTPRNREIPQRLTAVLIPAWHEDGVIGRMLKNTVERQEYTRFHIFVGVYPNDTATRAEVEQLCVEHPNIHCAVVDHPGPTKKSDCLNQILHSILRYEAETGQQFEVFVNHDAEDVIHAFELKLVNWCTEKIGMVQIPVFSLDRDPWAFVACHYLDEFAEWHTKDLVVRSAFSGMTPSAGVGTAFSREAMSALIRERNGEIFNQDSLTEDYDIAQFLFHLGFHSQFIRYWADMPFTRKSAILRRKVTRYRREIVATHEYFPDKFQAAVRQKARWMLGISLQGWQQIGWQGDWIDRYFLWRDRKVLFTSPAIAIAYILAAMVLLMFLGRWAFIGFPALPPLIEFRWVWIVIFINLLFLLNRIVERAIFVSYTHGLKYVWLSPFRIVVGNFVNFFAFMRAMRQFLVSEFTGRTVQWDKTTHAFPTLPTKSAMGRPRGFADSNFATPRPHRPGSWPLPHERKKGRRA